MSQTKSLTKLADDLYQLRLPLPFALNHVNVYLLHSSNGWTILDCGINWEPAREAWQATFDELGFTPADIEKIVLTHVHPDHFGLSGWLQNAAQEAGRDVPIYLSPREEEQVQFVWRDNPINFEYWMRDNGMSAEMAADVDVSMENTHSMTLPHPPTFEYINYGEPVQLGERSFKAFHAPGHSDGQLIFYDESEEIMLSGDHILMKITPNIGLWTDTDPNPLKAYMNSLRELSQLDVKQAYPGHRQIIDDWAGRIAELLLHHEHRLDNVLKAIENGAGTPFQVAMDIFDTNRFTPHEWRFAIAETLSHLEYLRQDGSIRQHDDAQLFMLW